MELRTAQEVIMRILGTVQDFKLSYRLNKISRQILPPLKEIEDRRLELVKKYGVVDEKTEQISVPKEKQDDLWKELGPYLDEEVDFPSIVPIPFEMLEPMKLSTLDVNLIEKFIAESISEVIKEIPPEKPVIDKLPPAIDTQPQS